jgi:hypothetical protein
MRENDFYSAGAGFFNFKSKGLYIAFGPSVIGKTFCFTNIMFSAGSNEEER